MEAPATVPRTRRTRAEARADNRSALLDAAARLVVERGYGTVGLDEIAERAGLTKGAIYSIFGSKLSLLRALADEHSGEYAALPGLAHVHDSEPVEDVLVRLSHGYVELVSRPESATELAFELELASLALRDAETLAVLRGRERAQTDRFAALLTNRARLRGPALTADEATTVADLVLAFLGGIGQRTVLVPGSVCDGSVIASFLLRFLP